MSDAHVIYKRQILFSVVKIHIKYVILLSLLETMNFFWNSKFICMIFQIEIDWFEKNI